MDETKKPVSFYKILGEQLGQLAIAEGQIIFTTDTKKLYLDISDSQRIEMDGSNVSYTFTQDVEDGHKVTISPSDDSGDTVITIPDNDTKYTASAGVALVGTDFRNAGVRAVAAGTNNGTIKVNTNGNEAEVKITGLDAMAYKANVEPEDINGVIGVGNGGTGVATLTAGQVLIGNGASAVTTRAIDTTEGGTASSNALITSGAVNAALGKKLNADLVGANSGVAELDEQGLIPLERIPGGLANVQGYDSFDLFPSEGDRNVIYVDRSTNIEYRWDGEKYVALTGGGLVLGEGAENAYRGDRGAAAYKHAVTNKGQAFDSGIYKITTNGEGHVTNAEAVITADFTALNLVDLDSTQALSNKTYNGYKLAAACAKAVDTTVAIDSASENMPTSKAVAALVKSQQGIIPVNPSDTSNLNIWIETEE